MYWSAGGLFLLVFLLTVALTSTAPASAAVEASIVHSVTEVYSTLIAAVFRNSKTAVVPWGQSLLSYLNEIASRTR